MQSLETNRRGFLKISVIAGVTVCVTPLSIKKAQATLFDENYIQPFPWDKSQKLAKSRVDGLQQVTGGKFFVRDVRAKDMPGWPQQQAHAFLLRATNADHVYSGLNLVLLSAELSPDFLVEHKDISKDALELPEYYGKEMLLEPGKTPRFIGQPVAILIYKDFEKYRRAKQLLRSGAELVSYGEKSAYRQMPAYGGARFIRSNTKGAYAEDDYSPFQNSAVFPASISADNTVTWPASSGEKADAGMQYAALISKQLDQPPANWQVIDKEFRSQSIDAAPLEPECINCWYDASKKQLHMVLGSQTPGQDAEEAAEVLAKTKFAPKEIIAHPCTSTGYGIKEHSAFNHYGVVASLYCGGLPVRLANDRFEQFQSGQKRHSMQLRSRLAIDKQTHKIQSLQTSIVSDGGGRPTCSWAVTTSGAQSVQGIYYLPQSDASAISIASRAVEAGSMRGYGKGQVLTAIEIMMDELAAQLQVDAIDLRLANVLKTGMKNMEGAIPAGELRAEEILRKARQMPVWTQRQRKKQDYESAHPGKLYGVGFACVQKNFGTGAQGDYAAVEIHPDGRIELRSSVIEIGTGAATSQGVICSHWMGQPAHIVKVAQLLWPELPMQTSGNPYTLSQKDQDQNAKNPQWTPVISSGSYASSSSYFCSHGSSEAARLVFVHGLWPAALSIWREGVGGGQMAPLVIRQEDARWVDGKLTAASLQPLSLEQLAQRAHAQNLVTGAAVHAFNRYQWAEADYQIGEQRHRLPLDGLSLRYGKGSNASKANVQGYQRIARSNMTYPETRRMQAGFLYYSALGTLTELAVDKASGEVQVLSVHSIIDCGTPIVPQLVISQSEGGVAMGIGQALYEDLPLYEGGPGEGSWNFHQYHLPRSNEVAVWKHTTEILPPLTDRDPPKGIAEVVMIPIIPAVANAISHATGARFTQLPITAEKIKEKI